MVMRIPLVKGLNNGKLVQKYVESFQILEVLLNDCYRVQSLPKEL